MDTTQRHLIAAMSLCAALAIPNIASAVPVSGQGTWESTLQGRDLDGDLSTFEAYYDTDLDITWLADPDYVGAGMNWNTATAWAAGFDPYGSGITGWRLPATIDAGNDGATYTNIFEGVDYGYNITVNSELSHMYYVILGNLAYYSTTGQYQPDSGLTNSGPFSFPPLYGYQFNYFWSSTAYAPDSGNYAWTFDVLNGVQNYSAKQWTLWAWAVHDGDVGVAPTVVPLPAAAWLFGSGLFGLMSLARRKQ